MICLGVVRRLSLVLVTATAVFLLALNNRKGLFCQSRVMNRLRGATSHTVNCKLEQTRFTLRLHTSSVGDDLVVRPFNHGLHREFDGASPYFGNTRCQPDTPKQGSLTVLDDRGSSDRHYE